MAKANHSTAFEVWKSSDFVNTGEIFCNYRSTRAVYRSELRNFLNEKEREKIKRLCDASETNEKLFWKLVKSQRSSSQMSAFLVDGKMITDKTDILNMWADHFETLGTPSDNITYDKSFFQKVSSQVEELFSIFSGNLEGILSEQLSYEEVFNICDNVKQGVMGIPFSYEHITFAGPELWFYLFRLYERYFSKCRTCSSIKSGQILPLFKAKGTKANNKDNYRGITIFPTLCKVYELILLRRLERFANENNFFSHLQFGFQEGAGCIEASFTTILETINHYLERGSKIFGCFLDVRKAFDTVWIDGLFYKLFTELGINGRFWLVLKDLYTDVNAKVLFSGHLSRSFSISQSTGQGRILAPFMYKVYINSLLNEVSEHNFAICISSMKLSAPSFADDISLLVLYPTFLQHLMNIAYEYSLKWRYEFNNIKSGIVTYDESKPSHFANMQERSWTLGVENVDELYEYKNLGVYIRTTVAHL